VPGISNVTLRTRYYGLYPLLSEEYAKQSHDADPEVWKRTVRRAEAAYALIAAKANQENEQQETGVAGLRWARDMLREHEGGPGRVRRSHRSRRGRQALPEAGVGRLRRGL
jgi:hypothetical protein